jgi:D-alanine-D-alanine ligase
MGERLRIAVIAGGRTPERDVSLRGGHRVMTSLQALGHESRVIDPADVKLVEALREFRPDLCWLGLHGKDGEDGTVQRLLDLIDMPFTGTAAFDCQIAFDKMLAKDALARAGVPTPEWTVVQESALRDLGAGAALSDALDRIGVPCVVKPTRSGSALGVVAVERPGDLAPAVLSALSFSGAVLIERRVEGTEVSVAALGAPLGALPAVEIVPKDGVYDYGARYTAGATEYFAPARLSPDVAEGVRTTADEAFAALRTRDIGRIDMIVDADAVPWVLEGNVSPGMTETSLVPMAAHAAGLSFDGLCDGVIRSALGR